VADGGVVVVVDVRLRDLDEGIPTRALMIVVGDISKPELVDSDPFIGSLLLLLLLLLLLVVLLLLLLLLS
jgi:hypothetical protein